MATTKLNNGQLPTTLSSKTIDNTNDISTTTTKLKISGGSNGQVLSTDGSGNLSWTTAGGVSDGDKGDITVSSSGSVWTIDNGVVTYAKLQDVSASSRLLGRVSSGSGDAEEITIGTGLSVSGTTLSVSGAPTAVITKTSDESITSSTTLQDDDELLWNGFTNGKSYWIELNLLASRINTANVQFLKIAFNGNGNGYISQGGTSAILTNGTANDNALPALQNAGIVVPYKLTIAIKATASFTGTFKWAQQNNNTTTVTVHKGSRMTIWEVA